jgi:hypothetical protein
VSDFDGMDVARWYLLFGDLDLDFNNLIDLSEWLDTTLGETRHPLNYEEFFQYMKGSARKVCQDPMHGADDGEFELASFIDLLKPISDMYFSLDHDKNGQIEQSELGNMFDHVLDEDGSDTVSRVEFNTNTEMMVYQMCYESA